MGKEGHEDDVGKLLALNPPLVLRREQLNSNFRSGMNPEDEGEDEEDKPKPRSRRTAKGKAEAKAKAKAKALAKAKATSAKKPSAERKKTGKPEKPAGETKKRARKGEAATWARRYPPADPVQLTRFNAIKYIFETHIAPHVKKQGSLQERPVCLWFFGKTNGDVSK